MRQSLIVLAVLLLAVSFSTITTSAQTSITTIGTSTGTVSFGSDGANTVSMCASTCSTSGNAALSVGAALPTLGTYSLTFGAATLSEILSGPGAGNFTVTSGGTETLTFTEGSESVTMKLTLTLVRDGTSAPVLSGTYVVESSTLSAFQDGSTGTFSITLNLGTGCVLDRVAAGEVCTSTSGPIQNGDTLSNTPEPSSMLLFGTGLLACGVFLRRRLT